MASWVCADCGATYDEKTSPCMKCASERLARLDDDHDTTGDQGRRTDVDWHCTQCGATHVKNNPPCNRCGNMTFEAVYDNTETPAVEDSVDAGSGTRSVTLRKLAAYGFGILAILNFTGSLILVAIVPAILHLIAVYSSFPPARRQLRRRYSVELSTPAAAAVYAVATLVGNVLILL